MKIFSIVGARPQFIKLAPLSFALSRSHDEIIVHTGQHYDYEMSQKIFSDLGIRKPDIQLEIHPGSQIQQIAEMILSLEAVMDENKPDLVIIFGDTNSTLAGATVASKLQIPIVHIEAGLRSYNTVMPEETNRIIADHISQYLFAPTQTAVDILYKEGLADKTSFTGDIMVDTIKNHLPVALKKSSIISQLKLKEENYHLLTLHRNYNVDNKVMLEHIVTELGNLAMKIVFPVHPRTKKILSSGLFSIPGNILLTSPKGYFDFIVLENFASKIITDSGGIQKEAYILKKPCLTLRTETEWVETVDEKWNLLINPSEKNFFNKIVSFQTPENQKEIFGSDVADKMVQIINEI